MTRKENAAGQSELPLRRRAVSLLMAPTPAEVARALEAVTASLATARALECVSPKFLEVDAPIRTVCVVDFLVTLFDTPFWP